MPCRSSVIPFLAKSFKSSLVFNQSPPDTIIITRINTYVKAFYSISRRNFFRRTLTKVLVSSFFLGAKTFYFLLFLYGGLIKASSLLSVFSTIAPNYIRIFYCGRKKIRSPTDFLSVLFCLFYGCVQLGRFFWSFIFTY